VIGGLAAGLRLWLAEHSRAAGLCPRPAVRPHRRTAPGGELRHGSRVGYGL